MSAKGTTWKNHKYIKIDNGRYIYSENTTKALKNPITNDTTSIKTAPPTSGATAMQNVVKKLKNKPTIKIAQATPQYKNMLEKSLNKVKGKKVRIKKDGYRNVLPKYQ